MRNPYETESAREIRHSREHASEMDYQAGRHLKELKEKDDLLSETYLLQNKVNIQWEKIKMFEKKYCNVDIDDLHEQNSYLSSKLELYRWKITGFLN